ncbi:AraC family transcriptional regulator [Variovorax sp. JS1663]|uniref:AraC family transcriptional regulator n=1 Tax=Variovorax sp. JS1663 TaxID=1851577 RepID=UPI000B3456ED|nr:AraC family transcriptional regulator [Variovorax sp. JS1663]OUM04326.1 AraC family transcriptional regulator [Variovorax sp. JS1663]
MDVLSEVLAICRSERAVTARFSLSAPWGLHSAGVPGAMIRLSRGAPYWIELEGSAPVRVETGDLVMLPLGAPHTIASVPGVAATPFADLIAQHADGPKDENPLVFSHGGGGEGTEMFSALLWFSAYCRHSVFRMLPPLIHIRESEMPMAGCLATTMQSLILETLQRRPGWRLSAGRMGELLLVNILRERLGRQAALDPGWLRGLTDPAIARAIMGIHRAPQEAWSVEQLAGEAAMSRSRFCARFKALVGETPIGYLTAHRMALAAEKLEAGGLAASRIAEEAGYESEKVFARAFSRWSGVTPGAYVRRERERRKQLAEFADGADAQPARTMRS